MGIVVSAALMLFLPLDTWLRLIIWLIIGLTTYFSYGRYHSKLAKGLQSRSKLVLIGAAMNIASSLAAIWAYSYIETHKIAAEQTATFDIAKSTSLIAVGVLVIGVVLMTVGSVRKK
jgi:APA family basic amino acid/polyamine antiporter